MKVFIVAATLFFFLTTFSYAEQSSKNSSKVDDVLIIVGWTLFGVAYAGEIIGVYATDTDSTQKSLGFVPVAGPFLVDARNISTGRSSNALNYVSGGFQICGLLMSTIGHVLSFSESENNGFFGGRVHIIPSPMGIAVSATF